MKFTIIIVLIFAFQCFAFAQSNDTIQKPPFSSPTWVGFRSAIIPGWGQWYNQKKLKAAIVSATEVTLATSIYIQEKRRLKAYQDWKRAQSESEKQYYSTLEQFYENDRNKLIWWSVGFLLLSVLDAYVDAHLAEFEIGPVTNTPTNSKILLKLNFPSSVND